MCFAVSAFIIFDLTIPLLPDKYFHFYKYK